jgi:hypothetical protein
MRLMETITILLEGLKAIADILILLFVPGFAISLVFFPRLTDIGLIRRLAYSVILSIGSGIASLILMGIILGEDTAPGAIGIGLGVFSSLLFVVWLGELWYLNSSIPAGLPRKFSTRFQRSRKYLSQIINSRHDRFTKTAMTRVVWHENIPSGTTQVDHTYLIDIGAVIDIEMVDEKKWKFSDSGLVPPPYQKTRNFELFIREIREGGLSLIDDLQIYPVRVVRQPGVTFLGHTLRRGALMITNRIYKKTDSAEIQWIYTHDFHLFAILYSQDTPDQMADRVLIKLDEIVTSIRKGSRVTSHVEETQKLKDEFEVVQKRSSRVPIITEVPILFPGHPLSARPIETDRRRLQASIVRDLNVHQITPETFSRSDTMIRTIRIPNKTDLDIVNQCIRELQNEDWLYT